MDYANKDETRAPGAKSQFMYAREIWWESDTEEEDSMDELDELPFYFQYMM